MAKLMVALLILALGCATMFAVSEAVPGGVSLTNGHWRRLLTIDCPSSCNGRCSLAGNAKRCMQFCMLCCKQCQCVPPGTYGNKEVCPCYANLKNSKGTDKCP